MGTPTATQQRASNAIAGLGNWISLHTAAAGTTGASEASGGSYTRQQTTWTPDGVGDNNGTQVNIPCVAGTYVESGIWSTQTGTFLAIPTGLGATGSGSGGTLASGTKYYVVTATNFAGETPASGEQSAALTGSTSSVALAWSAVTGAFSYNIYRGTTSGGENVLVATSTGTSYTDTGAAGTSVSPPGSNTASTFIASNAFTTGPINVSGSSPSINVNPTVSV